MVSATRAAAAHSHGSVRRSEVRKSPDRIRDIARSRISPHRSFADQHPEWKESYQNMIQQITSEFSPKDIPVMSVGALRFQPEQRHLMRDRFGMKSLITQAEVFPSTDGKLRYDRSIREVMFKFVMQEFKNKIQHGIYLCVWNHQRRG